MSNNTSSLTFSNNFNCSLQVKLEVVPVQFALKTNFWFKEIFVINPFDDKLNSSGYIDKHILFHKNCNDKNFDDDFE
jgi:hypothetical protein